MSFLAECGRLNRIPPAGGRGVFGLCGVFVSFRGGLGWWQMELLWCLGNLLTSYWSGPGIFFASGVSCKNSACLKPPPTTSLGSERASKKAALEVCADPAQQLLSAASLPTLSNFAWPTCVPMSPARPGRYAAGPGVAVIGTMLPGNFSFKVNPLRMSVLLLIASLSAAATFSVEITLLLLTFPVLGLRVADNLVIRFILIPATFINAALAISFRFRVD
mmetsp:Transcript_12901/g.20275  ORF Transcript_12901/g.20275 Transcript_12901/m.20275 type:complete len:219 (-) Transcript_12901:73-729(-)